MLSNSDTHPAMQPFEPAGLLKSGPTAAFTGFRTFTALRDLSDQLLALQAFVFGHAVFAKPQHTSARHALVRDTLACKDTQQCSNQYPDVE